VYSFARLLSREAEDDGRTQCSRVALMRPMVKLLNIVSSVSFSDRLTSSGDYLIMSKPHLLFSFLKVTIPTGSPGCHVTSLCLERSSMKPIVIQVRKLPCIRRISATNKCRVQQAASRYLERRTASKLAPRKTRVLP
jgi:hypothetical protein